MNHFLTSRATRISTILIALTTTNNLLTTSCNGQQVKTNSSKDSVVATQTVTAGQPRMSRGLLQDKNGNFWLGNGGKGVTVYNGKTFTHYTEKDGLSNNHVSTFLEDNTGKLWFGTADGVTVYDGKKFTVIPITAITGNANYRKTTVDPTFGIPQPAENSVGPILQDSKGEIWFGTSTGVYRYDGKTYTHFSINDGIINNTGVPINRIESILEDNNGNVWFGGRGTQGVFCFDGKSLIHFNPDGENWISPMLQDKSGNIWFSRRSRVIYFYDGKNFNRFGEGEFNDFFFSMEEDRAGNLWFGNGKNGGVTFYDGKSFINYTAKDGLFDELMGKILKAKDGSIWFSNKNNELFRFDGKTFTSFSE